jgi:YD repeat-containing protein
LRSQGGTVAYEVAVKDISNVEIDWAPCTNGPPPPTGGGTLADPYDVTFTYNQIGNITTANGTGTTVNGTYTYGAGSAGPHAVTTASTNTYGYDQSGNMTTRTTSLGTQTLAYDTQNRLQAITGAGPDLARCSTPTAPE